MTTDELQTDLTGEINEVCVEGRIAHKIHQFRVIII